MGGLTISLVLTIDIYSVHIQPLDVTLPHRTPSHHQMKVTILLDVFSELGTAVLGVRGYFSYIKNAVEASYIVRGQNNIGTEQTGARSAS